MNLTKNQLIAGHPAIQVRNFLREYDGLIIRLITIQKALQIDADEAKAFLRRMIKLRYLERRESLSGGDRGTYEVATPGLALANASSVQPITRKTAERILKDFVNRMHAVNASTKDPYAYRIASAVLFGSILSEKERLGDVDIAIELHPTTSNDREFKDLCRYRFWMAQLNGRRFKSDFDQIAWPTAEIFHVLRARTRSLSLRPLSHLNHMQDIPYRVLHGDPVRLRSMIPGGIPK